MNELLNEQIIEDVVDTTDLVAEGSTSQGLTAGKVIVGAAVVAGTYYVGKKVYKGVKNKIAERKAKKASDSEPETEIVEED